ncbi:MAG: hypothetical protein AMS17_18385 [Spirochaetes bacterium DG_61]|nr:MAG: hypothetical protein AMS17_18385 [Spirochaetes bacterium DG_61]
MDMEKKFERLENILHSYESAVVAFSGGVDSTFLAWVCKRVLDSKVLAVTVDSMFIPQSEIREAELLAQKIGLMHRIISIPDFDETVLENPPNRCYLCKRVLFSLLLEVARDSGLCVVLEGSTIDDLKDFRPGLRAIREKAVKSPLLDTGLSKQEIRILSRKFGLPTWDKPPSACLASRIPYNQKITREKLEIIEQAEDYLRKKGFTQCRVRCHLDLARIEVLPEERQKFFSVPFLDELARRFQEFGFRYVTFDLEGYKMGKLNQAVEEEGL